MALALGALGVINTWDLPTYALLVAGVCSSRGGERGAGWARQVASCWRP